MWNFHGSCCLVFHLGLEFPRGVTQSCRFPDVNESFSLDFQKSIGICHPAPCFLFFFWNWNNPISTKRQVGSHNLAEFPGEQALEFLSGQLPILITVTNIKLSGGVQKSIYNPSFAYLDFSWNTQPISYNVMVIASQLAIDGLHLF